MKDKVNNIISIANGLNNISSTFINYPNEDLQKKSIKDLNLGIDIFKNMQTIGKDLNKLGQLQVLINKLGINESVINDALGLADNLINSGKLAEKSIVNSGEEKLEDVGLNLKTFQSINSVATELLSANNINKFINNESNMGIISNIVNMIKK